MQPGLSAERRITVGPFDTAESMGSGTLPVLATPRMIALIEATASAAVAGRLEPGTSTVGTLVNVAHTSPTPLGMDVVCTAELVEVDRRRLVFRVNVIDEEGPIGSGTHERFVVDNAKFMSKARSKLES